MASWQEFSTLRLRDHKLLHLWVHSYWVNPHQAYNALKEGQRLEIQPISPWLRADAASRLGLVPLVNHPWARPRSGSSSWALRNSARVNPWAHDGLATWRADPGPAAPDARTGPFSSWESPSWWEGSISGWTLSYPSFAWLQVTPCRQVLLKGITSSTFSAKSLHSCCLLAQ